MPTTIAAATKSIESALLFVAVVVIGTVSGVGVDAAAGVGKGIGRDVA